MSRRAEAIRALVAAVPDPELPVLTLGDLGILRCVTDDGARVTVTLTPTYSGCPAIDPIRAEVSRVVRTAGYHQVDVRLALAPPWTTDCMTPEGREKLRGYGIAPPERLAGRAPCVVLARPAQCPRCGSHDTHEVSRFGSTPCQAQHVCTACLEPFDHFKEH